MSACTTPGVVQDPRYLHVCQICGIPSDAGLFDESSIVGAPGTGGEVVLARYELHRNYCGVLLYFAQLAEPVLDLPKRLSGYLQRMIRMPWYQGQIVRTPGYQWQIRVNGQPRDPYPVFEHVINPWGLMGFPINLRLDEGCILEFAVRNVGVPAGEAVLNQVGGRLLGRYWYNPIYGGAPGRL